MTWITFLKFIAFTYIPYYLLLIIWDLYFAESSKVSVSQVEEFTFDIQLEESSAIVPDTISQKNTSESALESPVIDVHFKETKESPTSTNQKGGDASDMFGGNENGDFAIQTILNPISIQPKIISAGILLKDLHKNSNKYVMELYGSMIM